MGLITLVEPQKKKKERFNVYIDGKFAFGLDAENVIKYGVKPGKKIFQKTIDSILKRAETGKLFDSSLNFLSYRPRSQKEVEEYLVGRISKKENVKISQARESDLIAEVVKKLKKYHYLKDEEFAKWWIASRERSRPKGKIILKSELMQKGIAKEIIEELLSRVGSQKNSAIKAVEKKIPRWKNLKTIEFKKKIYSYLSSRGFEFDTIREVVAHFVERR